MTLIEQMLHSPRLPQYVRELKEVLAAEQEKRQQFFDEVSEDEKAEFINGEVIVHSPVRIEHGLVSFNIARLLGIYVDTNSLGLIAYEKFLVCLTRNDYEPDVCYFDAAQSDKFKQGQMRFPAPRMIVEVLSQSTERFDRGIKFEDYAVHGVDEYWIVDPRKRTVEQYLLAGERFELALKVKDGDIHSRAIKGLAFPVRAAFDKKVNVRAIGAIVTGR